MKLKNYFSEHTGTGVLATADRKGNVNTAIYARPHVFDDATVGFIMRDRLTRKNILQNIHASYLFHESGGSHNGVRLKLQFISESTNHELVSNLSRRKKYDGQCDSVDPRFLVNFSVEKCLSLLGGKEIEIQ